MKRREFIALLGGAAAARPLAARAQQPATPVIGFVSANTPQDWARPLSAFVKGLGETGYADGHNVTIEYRWAEDQYDRLPAMVADLVQRQVAVIAATTTPAVLAAKAATTTIPIVFETAADPIQLGLVASLNRPGGNVTGVTQMSVGLVPKDLELLHELLPTARVIVLLVNPANSTLAETESREVLAAAHTFGLELHVLNASTERDFDAVFANIIQLRAGGLVIGTDGYFTSHSEQLAALAARHAIPTVYKGREFAAAGGLMSYGGDITDSYHLTGIYTGRVLKGDKPADLPVQQATKVEMFLNLKTAKTLGITVPLTLLGRADEVFE
ncbi:MAG TPA: ABC transporter substrate-binding protein [Xanthobacteraceae bacterium]|nr:ABC transporter substrate-binding protein [Xanthobacteraceae bacterium]